MAEATQRFVVNLDIVVTTDDYTDLDACDVEHLIKSEVRESWQGVYDLDIESMRVRSVEESPTEPGELVRWTAERLINEMRDAAKRVREAE